MGRSGQLSEDQCEGAARRKPGRSTCGEGGAPQGGGAASTKALGQK